MPYVREIIEADGCRVLPPQASTNYRPPGYRAVVGFVSSDLLAFDAGDVNGDCFASLPTSRYEAGVGNQPMSGELPLLTIWIWSLYHS